MANVKRFARDEAGVSPVIATILMIAVTVVLAIAVYTIVQRLDKESARLPPQFQMRPDEPEDKLEVISSSEEANWQRIEIRSNQPFRYSLRGDPGVDLPADTWNALSASSLKMGGGDDLELCAQSGTITNVIFELRDSAEKQMMGTWTFQMLGSANCP